MNPFSLCSNISLRIFIILLLIISFPLAANNSQEISREEIQNLINEAREDTNNQKYPDALEKLLEAETVATENLWDDRLWEIKNSIGIIYANISNFGEALDYFRESLSITQNNEELYKNRAVPLSSIGALYASEGKYKDALYYMQKAYDIVKETCGKNDLKKNIANNIAYLYNDLGNSEKSLEILNEVKEPVGNAGIDFLWEAIYIKSLLIDGQIGQAQNLAERLYKESGSKSWEYPREECYTCLALVLSQIYTAKNEYDKAIEFVKSALGSTNDLTDKIDFYEDISNLYLQKNDYPSAFRYKDSTLLATNELSSLINRNLFEINRVKLKVGEYQNELALKKRQQRTERIIFILLLILGLIVLLLIYRTLKTRADRQK